MSILFKYRRKFSWLMVSLAGSLILAGQGWANPFTPEGVGTTAATFLKAPVSPRSIAMGGAYTAVADGPESMWWNPAGLIDSGHHEVLLENTVWMDDLLLSSLAYQLPLDTGDALGFLVTRLAFNMPMAGYDRYGMATKDVDFSDMVFAAGYGTDAFEIPFGFTVKVINSKLADASALAVAGDVGVRQDFFKKDLTVALSVKNFGQKLKYLQEAYPLPFSVNAGLAYRLLGGDLVFAADVQAPYDQAPHYHVGVELARSLGLSFRFAVRAGYLTNFPENTDALNGLNAGLGVDWRINRKALVRTGRMVGYKEELIMLIGLDYAWVPNDQLAASHRVALRLGF